MSEWQALERVQGPVIGPRRDDLRAGQIAAMTYNVARGPKDKPLVTEEAALHFELPSPEVV